jgi:hypothetical protein
MVYMARNSTAVNNRSETQPPRRLDDLADAPRWVAWREEMRRTKTGPNTKPKSRMTHLADNRPKSRPILRRGALARMPSTGGGSVIHFSDRFPVDFVICRMPSATSMFKKP